MRYHWCAGSSPASGTVATLRDVAGRSLSPFILVTVVLARVALLTDPTWWWPALVSACFYSLIPLMTSRSSVRRGLATDAFIRHRAQRHLFYGISLVSLLVGTAALMLVPTSEAVRCSAAVSERPCC